jgi:hypothetical protein
VELLVEAFGEGEFWGGRGELGSGGEVDAEEEEEEDGDGEWELVHESSGE